jgi:phosphomannomutase
MPKVLFLFDVDGTLTRPRLKITDDMVSCLKSLNHDIGFVGGSDLNKQIEQLGDENIGIFLWKFSENGLMSYRGDELIHRMGLVDKLGEENYQRLINACLSVLSRTQIPVKRGNFIELRNGMINVSPIGRSCSQKERDDFYEWDKTNLIRNKIISQIKEELVDLDLTFSIGGQISMDIFPTGWDKTYCLTFVEKQYDTIYFFGDKTEVGGNDYEIYNDPRVKSFRVNDYLETINILSQLNK